MEERYYVARSGGGPEGSSLSGEHEHPKDEVGDLEGRAGARFALAEHAGVAEERVSADCEQQPAEQHNCLGHYEDPRPKVDARVVHPVVD